MTDRYKGFIVTLAQDIREDDAEALITALQLLKGVAKVTPVETTNTDDIIRMRVEGEIRNKLYDFIGKDLFS